MSIEAREYAMGTGVTLRYPWGLYVAGAAMCSDGKVRPLSRIAETADTFFSIPASVRVYKDGKAYTVSGYVTMETVDGSGGETTDNPVMVKFIAYSYGKNGHLLPGLAWRQPEDGVQ